MSADLSNGFTEQYMKVLEIQREEKIAVLSLIGGRPREQWRELVRVLGLDDAPITLRPRRDHRAERAARKARTRP